MILCITWLSSLLDWSKMLCPRLNLVLLSEISRMPTPASGGLLGGKVAAVSGPGPPALWCLLKPLFAVTLFPRGPGQKVQ